MTESLGWRELIGRSVALGAGALAAVLPSPAAARAVAGAFTFLHYTDIHVEPERHAPQGFALAVDAMRHTAPNAAFALSGFQAAAGRTLRVRPGPRR